MVKNIDIRDDKEAHRLNVYDSATKAHIGVVEYGALNLKCVTSKDLQAIVRGYNRHGNLVTVTIL